MGTLNFSANIASNNFVVEGQITANGVVGTSGQALLSGGSGANVYWGSGGGGSGVYGSNTQIAYNNSDTESGDANLTWNNVGSTLTVANTINLGNSTVNAQINSTFYTATSNDTLFVGTTAAANVVSNAQLSANLLNYAGLVSPVFTTQVTVGSSANQVAINTTSINVGNSSVNATLNSSSYTGTSLNATQLGGVVAASYANTTNTSATNITSGTLPWAQAPAGTANTSAVQTFAGNTTFSANVTVSGLQLEVGAAANNVTVNTTAVLIGNSTVFSTINSTAFSGTIGGTIPFSQVTGGIGSTGQIAFNNAGTEGGDANLIWSTGTPTLLTVGSSTVNTQVNATYIVVSNSITNTFVNAVAIYSGNSSSNVVINSTAISLLAAGSQIRSTSFLAQGATAGAASNTVQISTTTMTLGNTTVNSNFTPTTITMGVANVTSNATMNSSMISIGNSGTVATLNSSTLSVGTSTQNSVINATAYSLQGQFYANNATVGTAGQVLVSGGAGSNVYWSGTIASAVGSAGQIAYNAGAIEGGDANLMWSNSTTATLTVNGTIDIGSGATANIIANTTQLTIANSTSTITANSAQLEIGNSTSNSYINSTAFYIGNSTANAFSNSSVSRISNTINVGNGTVTSVGTSIVVGNTSVATTINSTSITIGPNTTYNASLATNGFSWLPNGLLMNWGTVAHVNTTSQSVTWANAFPTACFGITTSPLTEGYTGVPGWSSITTTGASVVGPATTTAGVTIMFMAIGH